MSVDDHNERPWLHLECEVDETSVTVCGIVRRGLLPFRIRFDFVDRRAQWHSRIWVADQHLGGGFLVGDAVDPTEAVEAVIRAEVLPHALQA